MEIINYVNDWVGGKYYDAWYMLSPDDANFLRLN